MLHISKSFNEIKANNNITFSVNYGEIYALLGENGAGKTTLVNMLCGVYKPDSGEIYVNGKKKRFSSPRDSIDSGIGMIHQNFKLVANMTAAENIILGQKHNYFINKRKLRKTIIEFFEKFEFDVDPDKYIFDMPVGEKQILEMLKVLYRGADILILDEPTAVLTPQETEKHFKILLKMKDQGCAVILITHNLQEVMDISDRVTVLRRGNVEGTSYTKKTNSRELAAMMVGKTINLSIDRVSVPEDEIILEVKDLTIVDREEIKRLENISFYVRYGEILGIAGIAGNGQKELCESIQGIEKRKQGKILFKGEDITRLTIREIFARGLRLSFIPEDSLGMGLIPSMDIVDNVLMKYYYRQKGIFLDREPARKRAEHIVRMLNIRIRGLNYPVSQLSSWDIEKFLLGREIISNPDFLVSAYSTRGLDIGSAYRIYEELKRQKLKGTGIIYVSEDINELLNLSDRIMVLYQGRIIGIVNASRTTKEEIGFMMLGGKNAKNDLKV